MTDLDEASVSAVLPDRPVRTYPALVATEADAVAWARSGGPVGAVVVADFQLSARRKGGWPWPVEPGHGLGFSLSVAPPATPEPGGRLYVAATSAVADVLGPVARVAWPDEVRIADERAAAVVVQTDVADLRPAWAVVTVLVAHAEPPRAGLLAELVDAVERRAGQDADAVLADYRPRCVTLGRRVTVRLVPLGPASPTIEGTAVDCRTDGRLEVATDDGRRAVVGAADVGIIEDHAGG